MRNMLTGLILLVLFLGCKVSDSSIIGKYIDYQKDDTLTLRADRSYEFEEKLNTGEHGWNTGSWILRKHKIAFSNTKPLPIVGCKVKLIKTGKGKAALKLNIVLNGSSKKINTIETSVMGMGGSMINDISKQKNNTIFLKSFTFEKLEIQLPYFPVLQFKKDEFEEQGVYQLIVFPAERLYELDKLSYRYSKNRLVNCKENIRYYRIITK